MAIDYGGAIGFGGKLEVDPGGGYEDFGMVVDMSVAIEAGEVDTTHQQSDETAPFFKEYIPGSINVELSLSIVFDPSDTSHKATILDLLGLEKAYKYTFEDGSIWEFAGFARAPSFSMPAKDRLGGDITIRCTGQPTFTGA